MCGQHDTRDANPSTAVTPASASSDPFPWNHGIYDAHCHPTDTLSSIDAIPEMRAAVLTVMATRSQDQDLVADVAASLGVRSKYEMSQGRLIPCFGWHPWFSYQLFDDTVPEAERTFREGQPDAKDRHYHAVLTPVPEDPSFLDALPAPRPLSAFLADTRDRLLVHPLALVGEVGLDKAFRLPEGWSNNHESSRDQTLTPGGREGRRLTPQHVKMPHQVTVLKAQLALAGELGRAVSVHGVQAHGLLHDTLASLWKGHEKEVISRRQKKLVAEGAEDPDSDDEVDEDDYGKRRVPPKPYPPRICLHSYSGPAEMLKQYTNPAIPARIFFSFSSAINLGTKAGADKIVEVIEACPDDSILVESDLHIAGEEMDTRLEEMYRKICDIKGWKLQDGVARIGKNYREFIFG
ncbi:Cut9-interacting protein scn1 [Colletotrichum sidae]|uniref:Cut9-interacting protein scn1 n=1 Tax=Colletotrichum sidae TaxID=1347389 RepID=A0A4R8T3Q7_9PEZI|nr:Cut9-interacting protein scn1 [Colletotrichum sidae]